MPETSYFIPIGCTSGIPVNNVVGILLVDIPLCRLGTTTSSSATVSTPLTDGIVPGQRVRGVGIAANSFVETVNANTSIVLNNAATASGSVPLFIGDGYFDGDVIRDDLTAGQTGAPLTTGQVANNDTTTHTPPRPVQKTRSAWLYLRSDGTNPLPPHYFWADEGQPGGDGPPQFGL